MDSNDVQIPKNPKCVSCHRFVKKVSGKMKVVQNKNEAIAFSLALRKRIAINDVLCGSCRVCIYKHRKLDDESKIPDIGSARDLPSGSDDENVLSESDTEDPTFNAYARCKTVDNEEYVHMQIARTVSTHKYCCLCHKAQDLTIVPQEARIQSYVKKKIFIAEGNRCCREHLIKNRFFDRDLGLLRTYSNFTELKVSELSLLLQGLSVECDTTILDRIGDFSLPEKQLNLFTGLTWDNIIELRGMMTSMRERQTRTVTQALVVFLLKLRTGNSNKMIASILQLEQEQLVSEYTASIIKSFENDILPSHFGFRGTSRRDLIDCHSAEIAKKLYNSDDKLMLICDGTYARHQKSSNNEYQRKSFSGQKKTPLCKPFTICTTTGYVIDILGPYTAQQNDATIMKSVIDESSDLCTLMKEGDIFVLDRGFRDVKDFLEMKDFVVLMPAFKGKRHQMSTAESNESRFVTKIRWAVEAVHGIIKQKYRLLDKVIDNKLLPKIGMYFRIAAFLQNQFGKELQSDKEFSDEIVERMKQQKKIENTLAIEAEEKGWFRKKVVFQSISSNDIFDFPEMTDKDLKILFTGSYQLSQAVSYLAEMMNEDGSLNLQFVKDATNILKIQVQSRHVSRKLYRCFVEYEPNSVGVSGIKRYACECANGRRTVGCCSHIATVVYYLSHARYLSKIVKPAEILSDLFTTQNIHPVIDDNSDEE